MYQKRKGQETKYRPQSKGEPAKKTIISELESRGERTVHIITLNEMHDGLSYKQKEDSPRSVTNGKADILVNSHFSSNLRALHANRLV